MSRSGIVVCLMLFLSRTESGDFPPHRTVRMRTVNPNGSFPLVTSRIHGGSYAAEGQFKYMIFLLSYSSESQRYPDSTCSASLIHPRWVLTAAHCVSPAMIAVAGKADLRKYWALGRSRIPFGEEIDEMEFGVQERKVRRAIVHPRYSTKTNERDFALLELDSPFEIRSASVAVLPLSSSEMRSKTYCTSIGWGLDDYQTQTFRLMHASVTASTPAIHCHYIKRGPYICLEEGGAGICKGDSGSPLVCEEKCWGVASFSLSPVSNSDCSSDSEEYYAEIYPELDWIENAMGNGAVPVASPFASFAIFTFCGFLLIGNGE